MPALRLTCVSYSEGDALGKALAYVSLAPVLLGVAYCSVLLHRRDLYLVAVAVGQLLNVALNAALKRALDQPRPEGWPGDELLRLRDSGMPSNHSQFVAFWAAAVLFYVAFRARAHHPWLRAACAAGAAALAAATAWSRVYLGYHTPAQVAVGAALGAAAGAAWMVAVEAVRGPLFARIERMPLARRCYLRDYSNLPNALQFEYSSAMALRAHRE